MILLFILVRVFTGIYSKTSIICQVLLTVTVESSGQGGRGVEEKLVCYLLCGVWMVIKRSSSPVTGLEWPRGFQEVKVPRLHDNGTGWW